MQEGEDIDFKAFGLDQLEGPLSHRFIPEITESFGKQRERIGRRIAENREKFIEETFIRLSEAEAEILNSLLEENTTFEEPSSYVEESPQDKLTSSGEKDGIEAKPGDK